MFDNRKPFEEPELDVIKLLITDVITSSGDDTGDGGETGGGGDDWNAGEF